MRVPGVEEVGRLWGSVHLDSRSGEGESTGAGQLDGMGDRRDDAGPGLEWTSNNSGYMLPLGRAGSLDDWAEGKMCWAAACAVPGCGARKYEKEEVMAAIEECFRGLEE